MARPKRTKCDIVGCFQQNYKKRKYCQEHWNEWRRNRRPKKPKKTIEERKAKRREWQRNYRNTPERNAWQRKYSREYNERLKLQCFEILGKICVCCGMDDIKFLTINHKNNDGNIHRKEKQYKGIYKEIIDGNCKYELETMCYNCNCASNFNDGICPHQQKEANENAE